MFDLIVIGGGAAGYFGAISAAEHAERPCKICILEQGAKTLQKVSISGGGRCNVTHAEFDPRELVKHYPRGQKELLGPFTKFCTGDTMAWFEDQGVDLKIEDDGRVFPVSDSSSSIIKALQTATTKHNIQIRLQTKALSIKKIEDAWQVELKGMRTITGKNVLLAMGGSPGAYKFVEKLKIPMIDTVPSLFSFNINNKDLQALQGLSFDNIMVTISDLNISTKGPAVITHWGISGPAVLKASAIGAVLFNKVGYSTRVEISWIALPLNQAIEHIKAIKANANKQTLSYNGGLSIPKRLYRYLLKSAGLEVSLRWADLTKQQVQRLASVLAADVYHMQGKTRFKDEFVTAGGIDLKEIDFRTFAIKTHPGLYSAGELLNIDGVTGGFNFQNAWTGGYLVGKAVAESINR